MKFGAHLPLQHFFATPASPCPYLPGKLERKIVTLLGGDDPDRLHAALSLAGFRRSQDLAYRPACDACNACMPVRIPVLRFIPSRSQRRLARRNADLILVQRPALATREHYHLFRAYIAARHGGGGMADMDFQDYRAMVETSPVDTRIHELRDGTGKLMAVCLVDVMLDGISLVYSFFDPTESGRGLGTTVILRHIDWSRAQALPHVYLGYWVEGSRKMGYKRQFRALEILGPDGWRELPSPASSHQATPDYIAAPQWTKP